jgi:membrane protein
LLLVSLVLSTVIKMLATWASALLPLGLGLLLQLINEAVSFGVVVLLFVGLMRIGSGPAVAALPVVWRGGGGVAVHRGQQLLALYLTRAAVVSAYGAAGSLVVFLMWMYFSSAVLLFAASCARALHEARQAAAG